MSRRPLSASIIRSQAAVDYLLRGQLKPRSSDNEVALRIYQHVAAEIIEGLVALVTADYLGRWPRYGHTATRLLTGDVLVTGGRTLVRELCYIIARYDYVFAEVPTPTATADLIR